MSNTKKQSKDHSNFPNQHQLASKKKKNVCFPKKKLDVEEGALLPSPTREKLMPAIPKSKDDESYNSQRGSPKKSAASKHGSPQKGSPQKSGSPKKVLKSTKGKCNAIYLKKHS